MIQDFLKLTILILFQFMQIVCLEAVFSQRWGISSGHVSPLGLIVFSLFIHSEMLTGLAHYFAYLEYDRGWFLRQLLVNSRLHRWQFGLCRLVLFTSANVKLCLSEGIFNEFQMILQTNQTIKLLFKFLWWSFRSTQGLPSQGISWICQCKLANGLKEEVNEEAYHHWKENDQVELRSGP